MNDFTKEELEELLALLLYGFGESGRNLKEAKKIQSMIDNYCDHKDRQYYDEVPIYECNKCHMISMK